MENLFIHSSSFLSGAEDVAVAQAEEEEVPEVGGQQPTARLQKIVLERSWTNSWMST